MSIYDFLCLINDCENIIFKIFDVDSENCLFLSEDEDDDCVEWTIDDLIWHDYANLEIGSMDMWLDKGKIYIEFNVEIDEEDF